MTTIRLFSIIMIATAIFAVPAGAQTRKPKRPAAKPTATPTSFKINFEISQAKEKVSNQVANVTRFTDKLGPIAASIETIDAGSENRRSTKAVIDQNNANKEKVREAIKNLRAGLVTLETDFRTNPTLRRFLPKLEGITQLSAESEDLAYAGKFTDSRRPLLTVLQKLADTLAIMP
jgi:methyl-accepting chemotaxis protein